MTSTPAARERTQPLLAATLAVALAAGVLLDVLTFVVARYGPAGGTSEPWSFKGNGALIVPLGVGPAILAGAWSALVLHARQAPHWLHWGVTAGVIGVLLVTASAAMVALEAPRLSDLLILASWLWVPIATALAGLIPLPPSERARRWWLHLLAAAVFPIALTAGFFLAELALSPGS
ncbi:MAG TPA: hypothetical protein VFG86_09380 [Chloroflexota bacterium]|nr:hypothetical protein [Chloroflexota bacterium]